MILGLDIGANNIKAVLFVEYKTAFKVFQTQLGRKSIESLEDDLEYIREYFELEDDAYVYVVNSVTMHGDTNEDGLKILNSVLINVFDAAKVYHITGDGKIVSVFDSTRESIYCLIGTNFYASAYLASKYLEKGILIDTGTSSSDIILFENETLFVKAWDRPDFNRMSTGELSFTGALHTPVEFLIHEIPFRGKMTSICTGLVLTGHVYALLNFITPELMEQEFKIDWVFEHALSNVGRLVGSDYKLIGQEELKKFLDYIHKAHVKRICDLVLKVIGDAEIENKSIVGLGLGSGFLTNHVAKALGLTYINLKDKLDYLYSNVFSALGVAVLGWEHQTNTKLGSLDIQEAIETTIKTV